MIKKLLSGFLPLLILLMFFSNGIAQSRIGPHAKIKGLNCSSCHDCEIPTQENPCLKLGAQFFLGEGEKITPDKLPPDTVVIDVLEDEYEPTKFPHKKHVHMVENTLDCYECHHFTPPARKKTPCKDCHSPYENRPDLEVVGLKAAYHRRCLTCHAQWSQNTNCELCHRSKNREVAEKLASLLPTFREAKQPEKKLFVNRKFSGPYVTFFHKEHTKRKNVYCADCHKKWDCITCHYQTEERPVTVKAVVGQGVHGKCRLCHDTIGRDACAKCHAKEEKQQPSQAKK